MRATIDDKEIYLSDGEAPAFSLSINSLLDPSKVKGISSTTIRGISTKELRRLGYTEHMRSADRPDIGVIRIGEGGVDYFTGGIRPASTNRNETEFIAVGGNASWFEYAKNTKIRDLDLGTSPIIDADYQRGTWIDEEDILCFPLADFGSFFNQPNTHDVAIEKLRPGLRAHRVLDIALEDVGFTIRPRGTLASHWKKFVHFDPAAEVQSISGDTNNDSSVVRPAAGGTQTVTTTPILSAPGWLNTQEVHDPNDRFNGPSIASAERYLVPFDTLLSVRLRGLTISDIPSGLNGTQLRIVLYEKTQNIPLASILTTTLVTAGSVTLNEDFPDTYVEEGWEINVGYWNSTAGNEDVTVSDSAARIQFIPATRPYAADCQLVINTCAKDFTVADLLKSIASDQFLVFNTNTSAHRIDLWYEREFFREPTPATDTRDWTDRMDHTKSPAKVYDDVALELHYRWKEDGSDLALRRQTALLASPGYGNADLVIGGYSQTQATTLPYAPTAMGFVMGGLRVPILRDAKAAVGDDEYQRIARLLYFDGVVDGEWTHDGDTLTEYPKCYFVWDATGHPIAFGNAKVYGDESENQTVGTYGDRMALRLRTSRILQCYLRLRDHELQDFDHGMPTLIDDGSGPAWYYVQEISQHRFGLGAPTKCTLIQIPTAEVQDTRPAAPLIVYPETPSEPEAFFDFSSDKATTVTGQVDTTSGYYSIRNEAGTVTTYDSGTTTDLEPGGVESDYRVWASDINGNPSGAITVVQFSDQAITAFSTTNLGQCVTLVLQSNPDVTTLDLTGMAVLNFLDIGYTGLTAIDLSACPVLVTLWVQGTAIVNLDMTDCPLIEEIVGSTSTIESVDITGCDVLNNFDFGGGALLDVDVLINNFNPTITGSAILNSGTNAAPTGASAAAFALLTVSSNLTVSGAGSSAANGTDYVLTTPLNGRDRYTHTGAFIFWNTTNWRIQTGGGDIYEGTENVMQPWLVTTWTAIGGTPTPVPTVTAPSPGLWFILHN